MSEGRDLRPELWLIAGPNGAGKSTLVAYLRERFPIPDRFLNPDEIARDEFGDWNDPAAQLQAARRTAALREELLRSTHDFALETVFSAVDKLDFLRRAVAAGRFVRLFFVTPASPEINAARVAQRVMQGGHDVPIAKIVARFPRSIAQAGAAALQVDRGYFFDNSTEDRAPRILFRTVEGRLFRRYESQLPEWAATMVAALPRHAQCSESARPPALD